STAATASLSVADPSPNATGHLVNGAFAMPSPLEAKAGAGGSFADVGSATAPTKLLDYDAPVSNDAVPLAFRQHLDADDALRTGTYAKTLTFTRSTTTP